LRSTLTRAFLPLKQLCGSRRSTTHRFFTRRWVIRDKDRDLKALLRKLERANSAALIDQAMADFKRALSVRDLLPSATP